MMDEKTAGDRPTDKGANEKLDELLSRLTYLESAVRGQLSRLYEIEQRLGMTPSAFQQPAKAPPPSPPQARKPAERPPAEPPGASPDRREFLRHVARLDTPPAAGQAPPPAESRKQSPLGLSQFGQPDASSSASSSTAAFPPTGQSAAGAGTPPVAPSYRTPPKPPRQAGDLESRIGGNWFNIIGVIAIVFGVGFFLKYAFDSGWVTPLYRVATGVLIGSLFLASGEWWRKKYPAYAYGLSGGGILVLYLSIWSSFRLYDLLEQRTAFVFMALVTALAALLAARYNALTIAILGLFGGFLTPILLSTGVDNQVGLFTYITLLDLGVLALALRKQWRVLNYLTFAATVLMSTGWFFDWYRPEKVQTTVFFFTALFLIFALVSIIYNLMNRRPTGWLDLAMVFLNALFYFGATYAVLDDAAQAGRYDAYLGLFAVLTAGFYGGLGWFTYQRDREDRLLLLTFLGLAFLFLVLAVPIQLDQQWVTMAWAIEGAVMTYVGLRARDRLSLYAAMVVFGIAAYHWLVIDATQFAFREGEPFTPLVNPRALSCAVLVAALFVASLLYKRLGEHVAEEERSMFSGAYLLGANLFAITLLSMDVNSYFEQRQFLARGEAQEGGAEPLQRLSNSFVFTLTALWSLYAAIALFIGITRKLFVIRVIALLLLGVAAVKVLFVDLWYYAAAWHQTLFNQTFLSFAFVIGAMAFGAWLYSRSTSVAAEERQLLMPLLIGGANLLALIALSAEVIGHYDRIYAVLGFDVWSADALYLEANKQFVLSVLWSVYATVALGIGIRRGAKLVRGGALLLLALAAAKIIAVDLQYYNAHWHRLIFNTTLGSFAFVVAALAVAIWFYARATTVESEERRYVIPTLVVAANLLAIVALSAEAVGFFDKQIDVAYRTALPTDAGAGTQLHDLHLAQRLSLSVIWAVYSGALLTIGIVRRRLLLRLMALLLLALTILKVFFFDLAALERIYRIISFFVLGVILLAVSFLYQRFRRFIFDSPTEGQEDADATAP